MNLALKYEILIWNKLLINPNLITLIVIYMFSITYRFKME